MSIATVSYVLNGREDQKISERTRKKVLQVATLLNYVPNGNAKVMRSALTGNIAVTSVCPNALYRAETIMLLDALSAKARECGRRLIYNRYNGAEAIDNADAAICFNFSLEDFQALGAENTIPLIMADGYANEPWFFQVNVDYSLIRGMGRFTVLKPENKALYEKILSAHPDAVFISDINDISAVSGGVLFTHQKTLYELFLSAGKQIAHIDGRFEARLGVLFDCIDKALSHIEYELHSFEI